MSKSWILLEKIDGQENFKVLAGTQDPKAGQAMLSALLSYKDKMVKSGKEDLSLIRSSIIEEIVPEQTQSLLEEDTVSKILEMMESQDDD